MALCRLTETGHAPYLRHSKNLHPIRDEPFLNIFLSAAAILRTLTASSVVAFIADLKDTAEEFQILRGRYDGRLVRFGAVECHWTRSHWRVSCVIRRYFVQGDPTPITLLRRNTSQPHKHLSRGFRTQFQKKTRFAAPVRPFTSHSTPSGVQSSQGLQLMYAVAKLGTRQTRQRFMY